MTDDEKKHLTAIRDDILLEITMLKKAAFHVEASLRSINIFEENKPYERRLVHIIGLCFLIKKDVEAYFEEKLKGD